MAKNQPQNRCLGYARVSTYGQTLDAQLEQLRGAGCTKIYREKVTGAHNDRRELLKMLKARSTFDLFAIGGARSYPHAHRRGPQPRAEARAAICLTRPPVRRETWMPRPNSGHLRSRGRTPAPAPDGCAAVNFGGRPMCAAMKTAGSKLCLRISST
jgi:hypothetical protein